MTSRIHYGHKKLSPSYYQRQNNNPPSLRTFLSVDLPNQQYEKMNFVIVPFNKVESNNHRFMSLDDAMLFIAKHCLKHYGNFRLSLARIFLDHCLIYNFFTNKYEQLFDLDEGILKASYHNAFQKVCSNDQ